MQSNSNPGQFVMSNSNGFVGSLPKFASMEERIDIIVTAGKRQCIVGLIEIFRPANLDLLY
jgi:hypothetical protein